MVRKPTTGQDARIPRVDIFPLAEVFGYPETNFTEEAQEYRAGKQCPFNNPSGPNCTKNSASNPLGVCSIHSKDAAIITCPVRFRERWKIVKDAARFFFPNRRDPKLPLTLSEVPIRDGAGKEAGNIDMVLVDLDDDGLIREYGALEIQAVYITGTVTPPFKHYMESGNNYFRQWPVANYPRPDYLSSSRKRLAPQLLYKGTLLNYWNCKIAVAVQRQFIATMPQLDQVEPEEADLAWLVYDLILNEQNNQYELTNTDIIYTQFATALPRITIPPLTNDAAFRAEIQKRIGTPQVAPDLAETSILPGTMASLDDAESGPDE